MTRHHQHRGGPSQPRHPLPVEYDTDGHYLQRITITLDLPGGPGTDYTAAAALLTVLDHLRHEAIQAHWVTLEITGPTP
jgi:hypothetical protein